MANFIKPIQDEKYPMANNLGVNVDHVKTIAKAMNGFYYSVIFSFNAEQSFEWRYRYATERDLDYERLVSVIRATKRPIVLPHIADGHTA